MAMELKISIEQLRSWADYLEEELEKIEKEQERIKRILNTKGYTIKVIKRKPYLYIWKYLGRHEGKDIYKWKCLGRADILLQQRSELFSKEPLLSEYMKLEQKKERLNEAIQKALSVLSELVSYASNRINENCKEVEAWTR